VSNENKSYISQNINEVLEGIKGTIITAALEATGNWNTYYKRKRTMDLELYNS
jgi:hypothetical protein